MKTWVAALLLGLLAVPCWADQGISKDPAINKLILHAEYFNDVCRDGPENAATDKACKKRDALVHQLETKGWCYGTPEQAMYERDWQRCASPSKKH